ncbi:hypothetical protein KVT40_002599 [Elsinoe batatas]|uniref:Beta-hexosaminidase n=1 Tax=Elsinoe batatas TaxID=2601811 RepID=A0A8K0L594_9PEZI|nr:hypothetical protein KVT40_002599 [Elsinoe batatas]
MAWIRSIVLSTLVTYVAAIWPLPTSQSLGTLVLFIDENVQFNYQAAGNQTGGGGYGRQTARPDIVSTAIDDTTDTIFERGFYPWRFRQRNTDFDPASNSSTTTIRTINLVQNTTEPDSITNAKLGHVDESYTLTVTDAGEVTITAATSIGISYGLNTFTQLFYLTRDSRPYTPLAPVSISDSPKFPHRGMNLDVARSYYSPAAIIRQINALAYNKMNRLHLHITDSQSWPLEVPALPRLTETGAYSPDFVYTPSILREIQQYGADRGVQVYLEIDMPGHTGIVELAYPGLTVAWNVRPNWDTYALQPPSGSLKLASPQVDQFLDHLFADVLPRVNEFSGYWHFGGDEVLPSQYALEEAVNSTDRAVIRPFMQRFMDAQHDRIRARGLTPVVWEEMLLEWNLTIGNDVLVQAWKGSDSILGAVQSGKRAIAGDYNNWYLDCGHGQWLDFRPESAAGFYPFNDYCSPRKNWRQIYAFDPLSNIPANLTSLVIGGEVHLWGEQADEIDVDRKVWPRAAAAAEVLWSGARDEQGRNRSQVEASPRLAEMRERLVARGVMAEPVHMPFCTQNGTQCAL